MSDKELNDISYNLNLIAFLEFRKECKKLKDCDNTDNIYICVDCFKTFRNLIK